MTDIEPFKTRQQREYENNQELLADELERLLIRVRKGEVIGYAIAYVDAASKPHSTIQRNCSIAALCMSICAMYFRFMQQSAR